MPRIVPVLLFGWLAAAGLAHADTPERIGPYRLEAAGDALTVRAQDSGSLAWGLIGAGVALSVFGTLRARAPGRRGRGVAMIVLGLGVAGVGAAAALGGGTTWVASRAGLVVATRLGGERTVARAEIDSIDLSHARAIGVDVKPGARPRLFELHVRAANGASLAHFALESQAQARALGEELAGSLGVPLH